MKTSRDFGVIWKQNFSVKIVLGKVVKFPPKQEINFKSNISNIQRTPLPNRCRVEIKSGTQSKRCEILRCKILLKISKKDITIKESQGSNPKYGFPEEVP